MVTLRDIKPCRNCKTSEHVIRAEELLIPKEDPPIFFCYCIQCCRRGPSGATPEASIELWNKEQ